MAFKTLNEINLVIDAIRNAGGTVPQSMLQEQAYLQTCYAPNGALIEPVYNHLCRIVGYSQELQDAVLDTVDKLMQTGPNAQVPGLLLGKIQSGKTRAFVGIMARAFDLGFDCCIVLSKSSKALIGQTDNRMKWEFADYIDSPLIGQYCKIAVYNVIDRPNFNNAMLNDYKNIFIAKKQKENMDILINMFSNPSFKNKKLLIIDDEADFVSHAFRQSHGNTEVCVIASKIDELMALNASSRYLQVTATPYSLYLQPDDTVVLSNGQVSPFRPRFTTLVPIHDKYIGGQQYFIESKDPNSMYCELFHPITQDAINHLDPAGAHQRVINNADSTTVFFSVRSALMQYLVASAIRQIQESSNGIDYHSSFLMHIGTTQESHNIQEKVINKILVAWKKSLMVNNSWTLDMTAHYVMAYGSFAASIQKGNSNNQITIQIPPSSDVIERVKSILVNDECLVQVVNAQNNTQSLLDRNGQLDISKSKLNIFIGGYNLDRGVTIDHVLGFMYGRRPSKFSADTVLQHCRMYGNRALEDMAVTRLHTTYELHNILEKINEMDDQLREWFINYMNNPTYTGADPNSVFVQFSTTLGIEPCGRNHLLISDMIRLHSFGRSTPSGFQTDCKTKISPVIQAIDTLLMAQPNYVANSPFLLDKDVAINIIKMIRNTYIYDRPIDGNAGLEWDVNEMIAPIEYIVQGPGNILCLHRDKARNMSRTRQNGRFVDAPEDGNTDTPLAKQTATNLPILMLIKEKGESANGWRDAEFYWPCLRMPVNMKPAMFSKTTR